MKLTKPYQAYQANMSITNANAAFEAMYLQCMEQMKSFVITAASAAATAVSDAPKRRIIIKRKTLMAPDLNKECNVNTRSMNIIAPATLPPIVPAVALTLTGNDKRKASCQKVGGEKKKGGHKLEVKFNLQFGNGSSDITYKAESDNEMNLSNPNTIKLFAELTKVFGKDVANCKYVSNKSGKNLQFVLGNIPELVGAATQEEKLTALRSPAIWNKYLKKTGSAKPADWLVYYYSDSNKWLFLRMDDVINFIVNKCTWRSLETGRIKGDFEIEGASAATGAPAKSAQFLTYEYRDTHKSHFLGANGNKGLPFIELLKKNLLHYECDFIEQEDK